VAERAEREVPAVLKLEHLTAGYYGVPVLRDVSVEVDEGEIVTIIGANGAGKSTLMRSISGLVRASAGKIMFDGERIDGMAPERIATLGIGHVPEGRRVFPALTVRENLEIGGYVLRNTAGAIRQGIERAFGEFPILKERHHEMAKKLSGGQQQMLVIARALMAQPKLLLMDEPSLGLAPLVVDEVFGTIQRLNAEGVTILLVEQNAHMALGIAHRAYVLESGAVVLSGRSHELVGNPEVQRSYLGFE
jgi:branched-chain amino acid transport system ATP-binding protein